MFEPIKFYCISLLYGEPERKNCIIIGLSFLSNTLFLLLCLLFAQKITSADILPFFSEGSNNFINDLCGDDFYHS